MRDAEAKSVQDGLVVRRSMFGDELVDANYTNASAFQRPVQDWLAAAVWGDIWTRDGVDRRTRSLVTIGMLAALNRPDELEMHLRAAPTNGCSVRDIQEILLQVAPYCGAPAALASFRLAERVLTSLGLLDGSDDPDSLKGADHGL